MKAHKLPRMTIEEFIRHEIETGQKYEYHNGEIFALAGGSLEHALLIGNIYAELRNGLNQKNINCKPVTNDAKLHIEQDNKYLYPDTMVLCGDIERSQDIKDAVTNPILIVEVLSPSTTDYDRGDKFYFYRQIPTLQEYVLIEQKRPLVEVFYRRERKGLWRISRYEGTDKTISFQSISIEVKMKDLYFDIDLM
jgi:Uma2 family endonuclease